MQIQNSSKMYRSMLDCAKYVYKSEGLGAFYISYPTTLSMTVPFTALQFLAYESISTAMNPAKNYDPLTHCLAGAVAGGFAAGLTTPMDVIKTMLQTRGTSTDPEVRSVNSFIGGCRLLYQRAGVRGFFKGVRPRIVTTMPSTAICWSAYEFSKYVTWLITFGELKLILKPNQVLFHQAQRCCLNISSKSWKIWMAKPQLCIDLQPYSTPCDYLHERWIWERGHFREHGHGTETTTTTTSEIPLNNNLLIRRFPDSVRALYTEDLYRLCK